jgi:serine/threonine protein kinase
MSTQLKCPQCGTALPAGALEGLCPACLLKQGATSDSATQGGPAPFEALPVPEVAKLFPQLEIKELIGKGGMGAIYKARQPALDRLVALKILPPHRPGGPDFAERFNREARALARLSHPNIVAVHEFGQVNGLHYFLMEFVDGVNLRQLERAERMSPREALQIVPQICDALQYAHDEGVVHRDIKPENVLVDRKGRVKIADFGLAKILGLEPSTSRLTGEGQVMGTPHYMAPEQIERPLEVDHRADIYALGVVFYEMLTGELPLGKFAAPSRKVQVDVRLDEVVLRALEKEPERRFQQASQVKTAVETITGTAESPRPAAPSLSAPPQDWWERMKMRFWPPLVGQRDGQRMIHWPAVAMRAARALMIAICLGIASGVCLGVLLNPKAGLLFGAGEFVVLCGLAGFILTIRVLRGFAVPLSSLRELDAVAPAVRGNRDASQQVARPRGGKAAAITGALVFLFVFGITALVTFMLEESYVSTARIQVQKAIVDEAPLLFGAQLSSPFDPYFIQTEFEKIRSQPVLDPVIERLNLPEHFGRRYAAQGLRHSEVLEILRKQLDVRQSRNTELLEIRIFSPDRFEAAEIANAIVDSYRAARPTSRVQVIDRAEPASRPARPNKPLNLLLGAGVGLVLAGVAAGIVFLVKSLRPGKTGTRLQA